MESWPPRVAWCAILSAALPCCGARTGLLDGAGAGESRDERCNGLDDDLDGIVDNLPPIACGVGACRVERPGCVGGQVPSCVPGAPSPEICNGVDDDCNGLVDDGLGFGPVAGPFVVAPVPGGALGASLSVTPVGLLAVWSLGFDGSAPRPNLFARPIGPDGHPVADVVPWLARTVPVGPRARPSAGGTVVVAYCGRFGSEDRASSARLDGAGQLVGGEVPRSPEDRHCGGSDPDGAWTGARHLFAWTTNAPGKEPALEVLLDVGDENGDSAGWRVLFPEADLYAPARIATTAGSAAVVAGIRPGGGSSSRLGAQLLDPSGADHGAALFLDPPSGGLWGATEIAEDASGGFLVLGANRFDPGLFRARIGGGTVIESPAVVAGIDGVLSALSLASRGGGFVLAGLEDHLGSDSRGFVRVLDGAGQVTETWLSDGVDEPWFYEPSLAVRDGRVFLLYEAPFVPELRIREFGCKR